MPSSSSKRARRSGSDRGRASPAPHDSVSAAGSTSSGNSASTLALQQMISAYKESVLSMVLAELQTEAASEKTGLPCPFQRRNPRRYRHVKDSACKNERGFKDIADLRDHIKRAHSSKYGCHYCKDRFQKRDNSVEDAAKEHRKRCKSYASGRVAEVSKDKPEVMTPEQDKLYFQLDFRRAKGYSTEDKQYSQYWDICKAIWPEYESPEAFEQLDLRNKTGAIDVSRLSEIMNYALGTVDISQFVTATSCSVSQYASPSSRASYQTSPSRASYEASPRSSFAESPSRAFQSASSPTGADYDNDEQQLMMDDEHEPPQYSELNSLYAVPQPVRYAAPSGVRGDSAYGSSGNQTDDQQNNNCCWQYGNEALGDQMLTDADYADRDIQLSGISTRDVVGIVSPGYVYSYGPGLEEDDLMMVAAANDDDGDGYYRN